ncbi:adaptor protein [Vulcanibacillus modesticaldus]|uniref:Adaptor protein n=1 Tax=Vulcanibacillus modesticaldus TaxID=337097 RepID=A0A1D2YSI0_9BACI|nr:genetic competence negative regulator [Vulcanibacillus modesticaldus]OEF97272.1 adaptor protein [Vulcanibacillus modesticaldus]
MRVERLGQDKIKIFLTFDDLKDRGINKEDFWKDVPKVHDLFNEIMEQAYEELGFELTGPIAVEIFALPAQGMVVIVSRGKSNLLFGEELEDELYALEVTLEESDFIVFAFNDFENLVTASKLVNKYLVNGGKLYFYKEHYVLVLEQSDVKDGEVDNLIAQLSEFGEVSPITAAVLEEYGKLIIPKDATKEIVVHFS